ncbi:MAG: glycerate kinase [Chthoniobacteraceae bacterium]
MAAAPPRKILLAPDKFKGSMSALEAAEAMEKGLRAAGVESAIIVRPIADGGEGTCELIGESVGAERIAETVCGPTGSPVAAHFYQKDREAYFDASQAAGIWRLRAPERNPVRTTTRGLGEQMRSAIGRGATRLVVGLGGSATCDGGTGMAAALGYRFFDARGEELNPFPAHLFGLARIEPPAHSFPEIVAACDVTNPLLGPQGSAHVFAPQKGASPEDVDFLEMTLAHLARIVTRDLHCDFREAPGAGAAGGLGFGLMSFCGASVESGFDVVAEASGLENLIRECDLIFTGEGSLDAQTLSGKGPAGIAELARGLGKPVVAFGGRVTPEVVAANIFAATRGINPQNLPVAEAMARGTELLAAAMVEFCASSPLVR